MKRFLSMAVTLILVLGTMGFSALADDLQNNRTFLDFQDVALDYTSSASGDFRSYLGSNYNFYTKGAKQSIKTGIGGDAAENKVLNLQDNGNREFQLQVNTPLDGQVELNYRIRIGGNKVDPNLQIAHTFIGGESGKYRLEGISMKNGQLRKTIDDAVRYEFEDITDFKSANWYRFVITYDGKKEDGKLRSYAVRENTGEVIKYEASLANTEFFQNTPDTYRTQARIQVSAGKYDAFVDDVLYEKIPTSTAFSLTQSQPANGDTIRPSQGKEIKLTFTNNIAPDAVQYIQLLEDGTSLTAEDYTVMYQSDHTARIVFSDSYNEGTGLPKKGSTYTVRFAPEFTDSFGRTLLNPEDIVFCVSSQVDVPTVAITSPEDGAALRMGQTYALTAQVTDNEGSGIDRVEYYINDTLLESSSDSENGYSVEWTPQETGDYSIVAAAYYKGGEERGEDEINVTVSENKSPQIDLKYPIDGGDVAIGVLTTLNGTVSDPDGTLESVTVALDGEELETQTPEGAAAQLNQELGQLSPGEHEITITAVDNEGQSAQKTCRITAKDMGPYHWLDADFNDLTTEDTTERINYKDLVMDSDSQKKSTFGSTLAPEGKVIAEPAQGEDRAVSLKTNGSNNDTVLAKQLNPSYAYGKINMEFNFYAKTPSSNHFKMLLLRYLNGGSGDTRIQQDMLLIQYLTDGQMTLSLCQDNAMDSLEKVADLKAEQWYHINLVMDNQAGVFDLYLNGEKIVSSRKLWNENMKWDLENQTEPNDTLYMRLIRPGGGAGVNCELVLDDIKMGQYKDAVKAQFVSAQGLGGETSTDPERVPEDLSKITVSFPYAMNPDTFEENVAMTKGPSAQPVNFTGSYDAQTNTYTAQLNEGAEKNCEYRLTFRSSVAMSDASANGEYAGLPILKDCTVTVKTGASDFYVATPKMLNSSKTEEISSVDPSDSGFYVSTSVSLSGEQENEETVTVIAALYQGGKLVKAAYQQSQVQPGANAQTVETFLSYSGVDDLENCTIKGFVWKDLSSALPLADSVGESK